jgi:hypothetical protein
VIRLLPGVLLLIIAASAAAQELTAAHMEGCLVWNRGGNVSVRNECSRPLALTFMDFDEQRVVTADLAPGARFTTDAVWGQASGFMFTACPLGSRPSVRFALENKETIGVSLYNCVVGRPSS